MNTLEMNKEKLRKFEAKGISFDILSRTTFVLNASGDIQPEIFSVKYGHILCDYGSFSVYISDEYIKIKSDILELDEKYNDVEAIKRIHEIISNIHDLGVIYDKV